MVPVAENSQPLKIAITWKIYEIISAYVGRRAEKLHAPPRRRWRR